MTTTLHLGETSALDGGPLQAIADLALKPVTEDDLPSLNRVINAAIGSWSLPERLRRLAEPSFRYDDSDLRFMSGVIAEDPAAGACGIAMWEPACGRDAPAIRRALLLHGLYVVPHRQRRGLGSRLVAYAEDWSRAHGHDAMVVRPWPQAHAFFCDHGFEPVGTESTSRLLWKAVA